MKPAKVTLELKAHEHRKNNAFRTQGPTLRRKGSLEHDKRFAKQELAKAVTPDEVDAATKKIADLDNERRDAKAELAELESQMEETPILQTRGKSKLTEAADEAADIDAEIDLEQKQIRQSRERFLSADQMLDKELANFKATKVNVRTLLTPWV